ncbi:MAG: DinB family protein, partial [Planctomycetia bacterium]|nr:DinB family protein [Planctomycetia bacterium]
GKWSTQQIICHIADFEPVYADRMKRAIASDEPTVMSGDQDAFAAKLAYNERDVAEELKLIDITRRQMARILGVLSAADFQRRVIHSESGPLTLEKLLHNITGHIPHHVQFIEEKRKALGM